MPFGPQIGSLEHGAHIIVGTPGRVEEHVRKGNLSLDDLNLLVLDEADRMLEMGFQDALDAILDYAPVDRQTLLFSATYPKEIEKIAADVMKKPVVVKVAATHDNSSIEQIFYKVDSNQDRLNAVRLLLAQHRLNRQSCSVTPSVKRRKLLTILKITATARLPCTVIWISASVIRRWYVSLTRVRQ
ncbi:ATP-dependent 23S rRNA helicase DbpA [Photobacterium aphoticum]|uniref:ATP-dependent 23S rRNA helicase DbpA n=1 Tax=Photobacterium aphoticum TaxID=754436 RepID=A0A090QND9_9GAMM|nr:ATP-dependent 23S rRNA helicase DbpA [Photobacterium aphoticum]